jgi:hypothetical protein
MPFLTSSGLKKLEFLKIKVKSIYETEYKDPFCTSDYSKEMAEKALFVLNYIQKNNEQSLGKNEIKKIVTDLNKPISIIDNEKLTGVPVIFNAESLLLAQAFRDFLENLDLGEDITSIARIAIKIKTSKSSESDIFRQHLDEININIQLYNLLDQAAQANKMVNKLKAKIATSINYYQKTKISDDIDTVKEKYIKTINNILCEMKLIPTFILKDECVYQYYNQEKPYNIDINKLNTTEVTSYLYKQLINLENIFNARFITEKPVSLIMDTVQEIFKKEKIADYKENIIEKLQTLEIDFKSYLTGNHLTIFQSIHPEKRKLVNNLLKQTKIAKESKNSDSSVCNAFDIYKMLLRASIQNLEFSKRNKISPGKTGNILVSYQSIFLNLAINQSEKITEEHTKLYDETTEKPLTLRYQ